MNDYSNVYCQQVVNEQMWIPQVEWAIESLLITGFVSFLIFSSKKLLMMEAVKTLLSVYSTGEGVNYISVFCKSWLKNAKYKKYKNTRSQVFSHAVLLPLDCIFALRLSLAHNICYVYFLCQCVILKDLNPLSANPTKWPNTHTNNSSANCEFNSSANCGDFTKLALK